MVTAFVTGCTAGDATSGTGGATTPPAVRNADWNSPVSLDGYTVYFTGPVDATDRFSCPTCNSAVLLTAVTITAGREPVDPGDLQVKAFDGSYHQAAVSPLGGAVIEAGQMRTEEVQVRPRLDERKGLIVLTLTGDHGAVQWRQESRS